MGGEGITVGLDQKVSEVFKSCPEWIQSYSGCVDINITSTIQVKSRVDLITKQMESDQAWTKNRLDDLGRSSS